MFSKKSLRIIKTRSQTLKEIQTLGDKEKEAKILEILKTIPNNDDAYYLGYLCGFLIDIYLRQKKSHKVVQYVNKLILLSGMALYEYCGNNCPFSEDKISDVLFCYQQEEVVGNYSEIWGKGRILQLQGKFIEAKIVYEEILKHDEKNINTYRMYARLYEEMYDFAKANKYFSKAEAIQKDPLTECMMATIAIKQYQFTNAESILKKTISDFPDFSFAQYRLIEVLEKQNKKEERNKCRRELLKNNPGNTKYILHTISKSDDAFLQELGQLKDALSEGVDYTSVNQYFGDYYFNYSESEEITEETAENSQEKALEFYRLAISNNKFCHQAYYNQINLLMKRTQIILTSKKEDDEERKKLIEQLKITFPYDTEDFLYFSFEDKSIDTQIQIYKKAIEDHPYKHYFYHCLADNYLIKSRYSEEAKQDLKKVCEQSEKQFPSSAAVFYDCYEYFQKIELYEDAEECILKAIVLSDNNLDIQIIAQKLRFYQTPDLYDELIKKTEIKFKNSLNHAFYLELAIFYYNKCYEVKDFKSNYPEISLNLLKKAIMLHQNLLKFDEVLLIHSLLIVVNNQEKPAQEFYNRINEQNLSLLNQIKDCGDVFDIDILFKLFSNKYQNEPCKSLCFWAQVLLYLLRYNLFVDQKYSICHYTSISALSAMLSEEKMSAFRLCSLGSANDPKEGKIIFDFLTQNIKDKETYLRFLNNQESSYTAVQASFTKLEDALTMFRLYGKKDKNEGTGINLIFNDNFFSESLKVPLNIKKYKSDFTEKKEKENKAKNMDLGEPLYWILYWDKKDKMYFNPQGNYKTLEINLNKNKNWYVLNKDQNELKSSPDTFYEKYAQNISFVLEKIKSTFETIMNSKHSVKDINTIKEELLNISYLIKDVAFYDEKELRIIKVESINNDSLKHDNDYFTLYKEYSKLTGLFRYPNSCPLEKIIIGPKVEQKETLREYLLNHLAKANMDSVKVEFSKAPLA